LSRAITRLSYVEGYWRIRQTIPLVLAAIRSFDSSGDQDSARFWIQHLNEESGHDSIMFRDLVALEGTELAARQLLQKNPISAPSVALIAYFERMVNFENPHTFERPVKRCRCCNPEILMGPAQAVVRAIISGRIGFAFVFFIIPIASRIG
jgi:hypothetical protein